jgi:hypothetical protein
MTITNIDALALLNQKHFILKGKSITAVMIDELKENIRLITGGDTEEQTQGLNGDKLDTTVTEH